ncbi:hypothetical protein BGZ61DRAFT_15405 [Ilyonectria robusta]|uniref:uncharacterized protein n=1 Tax=Ilyonectria robusta TaxID=1079257 RepID=UPI001E8CF00B|nr:uncharacterized protein BGZ61DRAFT_15405 [Ilyonectria robusta]KAH8737404.1 hypothetical protein BGZ61DRAFT_15405 [Ilyonectria robusta]
MHHGSTPSSEHADTGKVSELAIRPRPQATGQPTATARLGFVTSISLFHFPIRRAANLQNHFRTLPELSLPPSWVVSLGKTISGGVLPTFPHCIPSLTPPLPPEATVRSGTTARHPSHSHKKHGGGGDAMDTVGTTCRHSLVDRPLLPISSSLL